MPDKPQQIGPYTITREIGRGGMGVVYLARDTKLDRNVAIKALPQELACDPDRLARFEREAKVLASLSHANIGAIYGLEEVDGQRYLILEYIEGETLAERLSRGRLTVDDALEIALQIAGALESAHDKGVIHRDLKPPNIKFTAGADGDEVVKVLDFGLAKALGDEPSMASNLAHSPTVVGSPTIPGVILGTAGYLSPEQARGRSVDKRTDIFAFGCVLYEMLTGEGSFGGETVTDSIAATIHKEPEWDRLPPHTPPLVRHLLARCLAKDRRQRLHDIADARIEIEAAIADPAASTLRLVSTPATASSSGRWLAAVMIVLLIAVIWAAFLIGGAMNTEPDTPDRRTITRFTIDPPAGADFRYDPYGMIDLAISRDGRTIAYMVESDEGRSAIHVRDLGSFDTQVVATGLDARDPFFSPNGRWLAFHSGDRLMKVALDGGSPVTICVEEGSWRGEWMDDDTIAFLADSVRVMRVDAESGGTASQLANVVDDCGMGGALLIGAVPGTRTVLVTGWRGMTYEDYLTVALDLDTGSVTTIVENSSRQHVLSSGFVIFQRLSTLYAARFDKDNLAVTGTAVPVLDGVDTSVWADDSNVFAAYGGTLVYVPGKRHGPGRRLVRIDRQGHVEQVYDRTDAFAFDLRLSPDGRRAAVLTLRTAIDAWIYDLDRGAMNLIPADETASQGLVWSQDSTRIAGYVYDPIVGRPDGIRIHMVGRPDETHTFLRKQNWIPMDWTADGSKLLLSGVVSNPGEPEDRVLAVWSPGPEEPEIIVRGLPHDLEARLSPNGKWMAYEQRVSGQRNVFVKRFPVTAESWQVSIDGGAAPAWSPDSGELYYQRDGAMMAVKVETDDGFRTELPVKLFDAPWMAQEAAYDVAPDGSFIFIQLADWELEPKKLHVVLNWDLDVERLLANESE